MLKKQFFNILLISVISISVLPTGLFSMEIPKIQTKEGGIKKTSPEMKWREACRICRERVEEGDEATSLQCHHRNILHERCFRRRPIPCQRCKTNRHLGIEENSDPRPTTITWLGREVSIPKTDAICSICNQRVEEGTEGTLLTCGHNHLYHEACLDTEPCEFCVRAIPEDQMQRNDADDYNNNRNWFMKLRWPRIAMVATCVVLCGIFASKWFGWR